MRSKGFTLIELLVVIMIIGLLASMVIVSVSQSRAQARDAKRKADVQAIKTALEQYYQTKNAYPLTGDTPTQGIAALVTNGNLPTRPHDPLWDSANPTARVDYIYTSPADSTAEIDSYKIDIKWDNDSICATGMNLPSTISVTCGF